jgi:DNA-binding HxlR family transcriptional regulator
MQVVFETVEKNVKRAKNREGRSGCPITNALEVVGDRWTLVIIRDMMMGGRHEFHEFLNAEEGISTNILVDRLQRLQDQGIVRSIPHPTHKTRKYFYLTQKGKDLMPMMIQMALWATAHLPGVKIPKPLLNKVRNDTRGFMNEMLASMRAWEKEHLGRSF